MLPAVPKLLGRVFAHREQECPSGKGSFFRKVNKTQKTGFQWPRLSFSGAVLPCFGQPSPTRDPTSTSRCSPRAPADAVHEHQPMQPAITPNSLPDRATHVTNTSPDQLAIPPAPAQ
jgi:hypothetical protein